MSAASSQSRRFRWSVRTTLHHVTPARRTPRGAGTELSSSGTNLQIVGTNAHSTGSRREREHYTSRFVIQLESARMSVASHFAGKDPTVRATYDRLIDIARTLGPVTEEAKKTSIHLVRRTAFAGVATRRSSLIVTLKSATDIRSPRIEKREQASANRWHLEVRLEKPANIDRQLTSWLKAAYELAGPRS